MRKQRTMGIGEQLAEDQQTVRRVYRNAKCEADTQTGYFNILANNGTDNVIAAAHNSWDAWHKAAISVGRR